jgi:hypothetical protein
MPGKSRFSYFLSNKKYPVHKDSETWNTPLPLSRNQSAKQPLKDIGIYVTHGDYFCAVRSFLGKNRFAILTSALAQYLNRNIQPEDIAKVRIFLEKHGEFYHPARIEANVNGDVAPFVVNVAVSQVGKEAIQREYDILKKLNLNLPFSFLPKVYGKGMAHTKKNLEVSMFLGEWFEGFNEFHVSKDPSDETNRIIVWDSERGNFFLTNEQTVVLYRQAAMILTCYYNIETFEQISQWHHAAGDFVIKLLNNKIKTRLVTVRQYAPMFETNEMEDQDNGADLILEALLVFFLNLSIRMRLDRLNGVREIVWSGDVAVEGTLQGFFQGLALQPPVDLLQDSVVDCFRKHLLSCSQADLFDLSQAMVNAYKPQAPEVPVIKHNLQSHVMILYKSIQNWSKFGGTPEILHTI